MTGPAVADYERTGGALILGAVLLLLTALLTNRGDITSATLILSGTACFVSGLFILTFTKSDPVDRHLAALLPAQGQIEICTICADLGVHGSGYVLPPTKSRPLTHFIPVGDYRPPQLEKNSVIVIEGEGSCGVALTPSGTPLLDMLARDHSLVIPPDEPGLLAAIREVLLSVLELGDRITVTRSGESIIVTIASYRLVEGCKVVQARSPTCCTTYPCPVCSLIACLLAQGTGKTVTLERVTIEGPDLQLLFGCALP